MEFFLWQRKQRKATSFILVAVCHNHYLKFSVGTQDKVLLDQCNQELFAGFSKSDTDPNPGNGDYFPTIFVFAMCTVGLTATHTVFFWLL